MGGMGIRWQDELGQAAFGEQFHSLGSRSPQALSAFSDAPRAGRGVQIDRPETERKHSPLSGSPMGKGASPSLKLSAMEGATVPSVLLKSVSRFWA
jgi:hypothetical protein